ncbi:MAG: hypothetical protein IJV71_09365 [Lachnospiraceae bacterium]|nr:hypothetical protein [Lachnospiraceae bacterium]
MAKYKSIVVTDSGLALVAATHSGGTIQFTAIKTGNGVYDGTEVLESVSDLKSVKQTFGISGITREEAVVKVRSVVSNEGLTEGYYLTEIGLYALDLNTGTEILYAIIIAEDDKGDYFTPYTEFPQSMTLELYITVTGAAEGVTFTASIVEGVYATVQELEEHLSASNPHNITKSTVGLSNVPNVATNDQTPTYTAASANATLTSGEKLSVAFGKIAKAISSLISHLADKVGHITSAERTAWNAKLDASEYTTQIVGGTDAIDFNNLLDTKNYAFSSGSIIIATNAPEASNGILQVLKGGGYTHQVYTTNVDITYIRSYNGSTWSAWKKIARASEVLALTGGTLTGGLKIFNGSTYTDFQVRRTQSDGSIWSGAISVGAGKNITIEVHDITDNTTGSVLKMFDNGLYWGVGTDASNLIFHSGNSVPVVISETEPTDTTALWVW